MRTSILALCAIMSCSWYVWNWDLAFNSDFAMIGLVGRHILQTGEQFIYVPKVNYQGLLIPEYPVLVLTVKEGAADPCNP